jgi:gliding motility-associated-like protein
LFLSATGATSYVWDNGLGAGQNQTVVPTIDTMYIVTGSNGGCSAMDTVDVNINPLPIVGISNDTIICAGDTVTISATGGTTYTWDNGLGVGQSHQVAPIVLTTYIVTVTDTNSCSGIDSVRVTTNPLPVLTTIPDIDTTVCLGDSLTLFVTGASSYIWDNGLGAGSTQLLTVPYDTTYKVIGIDAITGCSNIDSVEVNISSLDVIASNDTSICIGSNITISATGAVNYTWDNSLGTGQSHLVSPTEQTVYIVTGDDNGCIGLDTVIVSIDNICFDIPNVFTPNGDGKNDVWNIKGLAFYPDITVSVFNRWGDLVFESAAGYPDPWDGTYNGTESPSATYYYVIVKGDEEEGESGTINIIR